MNNEETIYKGNTASQNQESGKNVKTGRKSVLSRAWKPITIGGVVGILMGGGALMAREHMQAADGVHTPDASQIPDAPVAEVNDDMSFGEAFAAARAQVGPGGVFQWHGAVFNTYTADEWQAMGEGEQDQFAEQVHTEVEASEVHTEYIASNTHHHVVNQEAAQPVVGHAYQDVGDYADHVGGDQDQYIVDDQNDYTGADAYQASDDVVASVEGFELEGVRIVGYGEVEGHTIVGYDADGDDDPDVAIIDLDDSGNISEPDVIMDSEGNMVTVEELQEMEVDEGPDYSSGDNFYANNPDVADDGMPDYMDDAMIDA